jgi:hypothetical protein
MRHLALASISLFLFACVKDPPIVDMSDESSEGSSGGGSSSEGGETSTGSTTDAPTTSSGTGDQMCLPGQVVACACMNGDPGSQECAPDGLSYGPCECEGSETVDPSTTTGDPGTSTTDPGTTDTGDTGSTSDTGSTTDTGDACVDPGPEPNEEPMMAVDLGAQPCDGEHDMFAGVLDGDADVDWFMFVGEFEALCGVNDPVPTFTLTASDPLRMCVYFTCDMGMADVMCQGNATPDMVGPASGCCDMDADITAAVNCAGNPDETAEVFVVLDQAPADACVEYAVDYFYEGGD